MKGVSPSETLLLNTKLHGVMCVMNYITLYCGWCIPRIRIDTMLPASE
jgi:hypothetical protein